MPRANFFIKNAYIGLSGIFGFYGASRQWRAEIKENDIMKFPGTTITKPERFVFSVTNGFLYATPGVNMYYMYTLYDRLSYKWGYTQTQFVDSYRELFGVCKEAF